MIETSTKLDGSLIYWLLFEFLFWDSSGRRHLGIMAFDITDQKRAEERVIRLNRFYSLLSSVNQTIMRERNPEALIDKICRVCVERGGLRMVWVGMIDPEKRMLRPVAHYGFEDDYLEGGRLLTNDSNSRDTAEVIAVLERKAIVIDDVGHDRRMGSWRAKATVRGYRSIAALPLRKEADVIGCISFNAGDRGFFDDESVKVLTEVGAGISYALEFAEQEEARRQAEAELRKSHDLLQMQIDRMPIAYITWDTDFHVMAWNPAAEKLFGFTASEVIGKHLFNLIVPRDVQPHLDEIRDRLLKGDMDAHGVNENITKDGRRIICDWNNTPLRRDDGTVFGALSMALDITERRRMEEELRRYSEHLEEIVEEKTKELSQAEHMAAIGQTTLWVGHDLRNPLQVLVNALYGARQLVETVSPMALESAREEGLELISTAEDQTRYMDKIISDIHDYANPVKARPMRTDFRLLIDEAMSNVDVPSSIKVSREIDEGLFKVEVDPVIIRRAFSNLIRNAAEAMPEGGQLTIKATRIDDNALVSFEDTGIGIPEENMSKVFKPFFTTKARGQGLGLSVCKRLLDAHGGNIVVESKVGEGTKVTVTIPLNFRTESESTPSL